MFVAGKSIAAIMRKHRHCYRTVRRVLTEKGVWLVSHDIDKINAERKKKGYRPLTVARLRELETFYTGSDFITFATNFTLDAAEEAHVRNNDHPAHSSGDAGHSHSHSSHDYSSPSSPDTGSSYDSSSGGSDGGSSFGSSD